MNVDYGGSWVECVGGALVKAGVFVSKLEFTLHYPDPNAIGGGYGKGWRAWSGKKRWFCYTTVPVRKTVWAWEAVLITKRQGNRPQVRRIVNARVYERRQVATVEAAQKRRCTQERRLKGKPAPAVEATEAFPDTLADWDNT